MSHRLPDWPARFAAFMQEHHAMPFKWGVQDCCQFARKCVRTLRGKDPAKGMGLRKYKTARGALSQLKRLGGIENLPVRAKLEEISVRRAQRGDVVLGTVASGGALTLGVCIGEKAAFAGPEGLEFVFTIDCQRAWRV